MVRESIPRSVDRRLSPEQIRQLNLPAGSPFEVFEDGGAMYAVWDNNAYYEILEWIPQDRDWVERTEDLYAPSFRPKYIRAIDKLGGQGAPLVPESLYEAGGSGYSAAFTHPDPLDPNDAQRQRTQSRALDYPYDSKVSYGADVGTDLDGGGYQRARDRHPPTPHDEFEDDVDTTPKTVWESLRWVLETTGAPLMSEPRRAYEVDVYFDDDDLMADFEARARQRGLGFRIINMSGPAGGNPLIELTGTQEAVRAFLLQNYDNDEEEVDAIMQQQNESLLDPYENGPQADDAPSLGYGNHGRMGDGLDPEELDLDALRQDFRTCFLDTLPRAQKLGRRDLFGLLVRVDPDYSAELFAPDDDSEMLDLYSQWGQRVYAPGAEFDAGVEVDTDGDE